MKCKWCESRGGEMGLMEIHGYDWDSADDDALSIKRVLGHQCVNATQCAERVIANANSLEGLQRVSADYENLGELANEAAGILHKLNEIAWAQAHTDDLVAREIGRL